MPRSKYNWSEMDGKDIINALNNDPETKNNCQWEKISSFEWTVILKVKPELADKCDWKKTSCLESNTHIMLSS